jgi:hypothetical protein
VGACDGVDVKMIDFLLLCLRPLLFLLLVGAWDVKLIDVDVSIKATMVFWVKLAMIRVNV